MPQEPAVFPIGELIAAAVRLVPFGATGVAIFAVLIIGLIAYFTRDKSADAVRHIRFAMGVVGLIALVAILFTQRSDANSAGVCRGEIAHANNDLMRLRAQIAHAKAELSVLEQSQALTGPALVTHGVKMKIAQLQATLDTMPN